MTGPDARTRVVAIIGDPVAHSLSPRMHNAAFTALGLNWTYLAFRVPAADLPQAVRGIKGLGFAGFNVTVPHKEAVLPLLDEVDATAARIGAVNTVRVDEERLVGFNTDAPGVLDALEGAGGARVPGGRCLVLGAGGGGRAAAFGLAQAGAAKVVILNRTRSRAEKLVQHVAAAVRACDVLAGPLDASSVERFARDADIIVQATSATMSAAMGGLGGRAPWLDAIREHLRRGMTVLDMVYTPKWTDLLASAREAGAAAVSGLSLLVHQGARSFELWTGRPAPVDVMKRAVDAEIPDRG
jgi:shikimate dehydrogenase